MNDLNDSNGKNMSTPKSGQPKKQFLFYITPTNKDNKKFEFSNGITDANASKTGIGAGAGISATTNGSSSSNNPPPQELSSSLSSSSSTSSIISTNPNQSI